MTAEGPCYENSIIVMYYMQRHICFEVASMKELLAFCYWYSQLSPSTDGGCIGRCTGYHEFSYKPSNKSIFRSLYSNTYPYTACFSLKVRIVVGSSIL